MRWLDVLGVADGIGRGSARMDLTTAHAPTVTSAHGHVLTRPDLWRRPATVLLPAIDQHGAHDHRHVMSSRSVRARLARATHATQSEHAHGAETADATGRPGLPALPPCGPRPAHRDLEQVLTDLDAIADDADALNQRILALLEHR